VDRKKSPSAEATGTRIAPRISNVSQIRFKRIPGGGVNPKVPLKKQPIEATALPSSLIGVLCSYYGHAARAVNAQSIDKLQKR